MIEASTSFALRAGSNLDGCREKDSRATLATCGGALFARKSLPKNNNGDASKNFPTGKFRPVMAPHNEAWSTYP